MGARLRNFRGATAYHVCHRPPGPVWEMKIVAGRRQRTRTNAGQHCVPDPETKVTMVNGKPFVCASTRKSLPGKHGQPKTVLRQQRRPLPTSKPLKIDKFPKLDGFRCDD